MKIVIGVVLFQFLFITLSLAIRETIFVVREVSTNPNGIEPHIVDTGMARFVSGGLDIATSPSNPPPHLPNIEMMRLVPSGPSNETSPSPSPHVARQFNFFGLQMSRKN
ncbi:unnamed protein product [Cochlearia groenlandica]